MESDCRGNLPRRDETPTLKMKLHNHRELPEIQELFECHVDNIRLLRGQGTWVAKG
jgi:hypothetical protein